jgi:hypothetical protein|tara:strand:- start:81 stop:743 length:663 start_codon:yes stop_codon:yes gene_type:complete
MKLSDTTISVLKNYSSINQNLKISASNNLVTMSAMKNIVAQAKVEETFEKDVAIYDLNEFLAAMSLFESPELDFQNEYVMMGNEGKTSSLKYWYSDPSVVTTVTKDITMPSTEVTFTLSSDELSQITKSAAVIGAPDMVLENGSLKVTDKKNQTANAFSMNVAKSDSDVDYAFWFKVENLKLMPGTYDVSVSSKKISYFHNTSVDIGYYIALEPESHYGQ